VKVKKTANMQQMAKKRIKDITKEIADIKETTKDLEIRWNTEKDILAEVRKIKKELETLKTESESAELQSDFARVAEIRYGKIPSLEKLLNKNLIA
jgi:ATP-dependent Clp protease ATP-binding subunit ClpB